MYTTWFIRVSPESNVASFSFLCGTVLKNSAQQPSPGPKREPLSLMQSLRGVGPFFWFDNGGKVYVLAVMSLLLNLRAGGAALIELVLVTAQTPMRFSLGAKFPVSEPSPSVELRKNSVPPLAVEAPAAGEMDGHTVKLLNWPSTGLSNDTMAGVMPAISCALDNA